MAKQMPFIPLYQNPLYHFKIGKIGKKGLKKTMSKNAEFKKWVYQIMALNHLPSNKIEAAFRELCARPIPLSATAKKAKESFQRYWERLWLNTIGVDRFSVYRAPLRITVNHITPGFLSR